jgi:serine/threonine-protein kinase
MKKDPAERFQNVGELAIALLPFAPKRARICAERACQVLWSAGLTQGRLRVMSTAPPPNSTDPNLARESRVSGIGTGNNLPSIDEHAPGMALHVESKPQKRMAMMVALGAAAVVAVGVAAALALRAPAHPATTTADTVAPVSPHVEAARPTVSTATAAPTADMPAAATATAAAPELDEAAGRDANTAATAARTLQPRRLAPVLTRPGPAAPPSPVGDVKPKPKATADEPDLGY